MNRLATELVKGILSEADIPRKEIVGMFGGGFKPPTGKGYISGCCGCRWTYRPDVCFI